MVSSVDTFSQQSYGQPWKTGRSTEFADQVVKSLSVTGIFRIEFAQRAFQPKGSQYRRSTMSRSDAEDHVKVVLPDEKVQMGIR